MADLDFTRCRAVIDRTTDDAATAYAASECDIENGIVPLPCSMESLAKCGGVGVVFDESRKAGEFPQPGGDRKITPSLDMMTSSDFSFAPADRTAETYADG